MRNFLEIPPREAMVVTHDDDPLEWYYKPIIRKFYLHRFRMILDLLALESKREKILEVGFGSGFLFPSLRHFAKELYGADVHSNVKIVENLLIEKQQTAVRLVTASVYELPYEAGYFDCVIAVSLLEQLEALERAILEIARVTKPGGEIILGFPTRNVLMHILFRLLLRGRSDHDFHVSTHLNILEAIQKHLRIEKTKLMPPGVPLSMAMYVACRCRRLSV